jgi:L-asparaginase II
MVQHTSQNAFPDDCAVSDRDGVTENIHRVHAAVTDATGKLLYAVGNPQRLTLLRSSAKPFQTLAVLETPGFEKYGFDEADVALMCASHSSEDRHIMRATQMLGKVQGAQESDLRCGGHPAVSPNVNRDWIRRGFTPSPLCSNCSGKHVAMLAAALALSNGKSKDYHRDTDPLQQRVRRIFEDLSGLPPSEIQYGTDGCNAPAPALRLQNFAHIWAIFADAASRPLQGDSSASPRSKHLGRIYSAMSRYPEMVAGEGRFCTELAQAYQGALVGKIGADACYGIAVPESDLTRRLGATGGLALAVKLDDGNIEIMQACVMEILEQLGIVGPQTKEKLDHFHHLKLFNTAGVFTGVVSLPFQVRRV